ncbi:MAG TPA: hypothetical protein PLK24_06160 [Atribacter sp.]|uniref:hypothetical protein n=1 Tax=Atribacter sp. TaxID=2847780 RepID=UPI002C9796C5|nr:hypothetical protein [Atribacter sp.]HQK83511.1 hypothetical protein [Atribacter sp.]
MLIKRSISFFALISILVVSFLFAGCVPGSSPNQFSTNGTVTYIDLEGGFYGIIGDNQENYDPINLPDEFQQDGLQVAFTAKYRDDLAGFHMWGRIIEILQIEAINSNNQV